MNNDAERGVMDPDEERGPVRPDEEEILELEQHWLAAEIAGGRDELDAISVDNFLLVGPLGFVLDKAAWLDRWAGGLDTQSLTWEEVSLRIWSDSAIAIGEHRQQATFQGRPADGLFRATHMMVRTPAGWRLAGMQLSPILQP